MTKTLYVHATAGGEVDLGHTYATHYLTDELVVAGQNVFEEYELESRFDESNFNYYYYQNSADAETFTRPSDINAVITYPDNGFGQPFTRSAWHTVYVDDSYVIPAGLDKTGLSGPFSFSPSYSAGISTGSLSYSTSGGVTYGGYSLSGLSNLSYSSVLGLLGRGMTNAGYGALSTALNNVSVVQNVVTSITSSGLALLDSGIAGVSNPNFSAAAYDAQVNAYLSGVQATTSQGFDNLVLIPGNSGADAAAHTAVRSLGLVGGEQTSANAATVQVDFMLGGATISTSVTAAVGMAVGGQTPETIYGRSAQNILIGGQGNDAIYAGSGNDYINGGAGDDLIVTGSGNSFVDGGAGYNTLQLSTGGSATSVTVDGNGNLHLVSGNQDTTAVQVQAVRFADQTATTGNVVTIADDYETLLGRAPTGAELAVWTSALSSGASVAAMSAAISGADAAGGGSGEAALIETYYHAYFGRAPTPSEIAVWEGQLRSGAANPQSFSALLANVSDGQGQLSAMITTLYQQYLGRSATSAEIGYWSGALRQGTVDERTFATTLAAQTGAATNELTSLYQAYLGSTPSSSDLSYWTPKLVDGLYSADQIKTVLLSDPSGQNHTSSALTSLYQTYFGRSPQVSEITVWQNLLKSGDTFGDVQAALIASPGAQAHNFSTITQLYDTYFGRDPSVAELNVWETNLQSGATYATITSALLNDPAGMGHASATISSYYSDFLGRPPTAGELAVWQANLLSGQTFAQARAAIVTAGQVYVDFMITQDFQTYLGRAPTAAEYTQWFSAIQGGSTYAMMNQSLANTSAGAAWAKEIIYRDFEESVGNIPTAADVNTWYNALQSGSTYDQVATSIAADPRALSHSSYVVYDLYVDYMGRYPNISEWNYWRSALANGTTVSQMRATLASDPGNSFLSAEVINEYQYYLGRAPSSVDLQSWLDALQYKQKMYDLFRNAPVESLLDYLLYQGQVENSTALGMQTSGTLDFSTSTRLNTSYTLGNTIVTHFNPAQDQLAFYGAQYKYWDPLANAVEVTEQIGGQSDVIITFHYDPSATASIGHLASSNSPIHFIIQNVTLSQLSEANFYFG